MLAQNFMTPEALGITSEQHEALVKTLRVFECGELPGGFNMGWWGASHTGFCGTTCCIGGWAERLGNLPALSLSCMGAAVGNMGLTDLFYPMPGRARDTTNTSQGAAALRNYLTTGDPQWELVMETVS